MIVISSLAMLAASMSHDASPVDLLVGKPGLRPAALQRAIRGVAKLVEKESSGLYRIRLIAGVDRREGQNLLAKRGVYLQFDAGAKDVDPNSLPSVSAHIGYLKGVAKLQPGQDEEEAAAQSGRPHTTDRADFAAGVAAPRRPRTPPDPRPISPLLNVTFARPVCQFSLSRGGTLCEHRA